MPSLIPIADKVALMLGIQLAIAGRRIGMTDERFVPIRDKVRGRGLTRYTIKRAALAALVFGLVWSPLSWMRIGRIDGIIAFAVLYCFVIASVPVPIRWWQHENRFLRLTMPVVAKRFD